MSGAGPEEAGGTQEGGTREGLRGTGGASGRVRNVFSGQAQQVAQVRDVYGDVVQSLPPVPVRPMEVPRQVPAAVAGFVNRVRELAALRDVSADPHDVPRIVTCSGLRGVGKSAMVRRFAHSARDRFPGGQLHVDYGELRHRGGAPIGDAVASCLRGLGVDDRYIPAQLAERVSLFRTRTADHAVLVVLDDVWEPKQVRALVPNSPGSLVLITSDRPLRMLGPDGAESVELGELSSRDGVLLLASRCGHSRVEAEPEAAKRLVGLCAGLPLALQVAAARLVGDPGLRVGDLVAELADERRRLDGLRIGGDLAVSAVIATVYQNLPDSAARLYRSLGLLPGPTFTGDVAAILVGRSLEEIRADLATLMEHRLVEQVGPGRYQFQALARLHARVVTEAPTAASAGDNPLDVALRRVAEHYLARAVQADHAVMGQRTRTPGTAGPASPFADRPSALAWLEEERANLMAIQRAADERGWLDLVWQYAETLTALFFNHRHLSDWYESGTRGAAAAGACGRRDAQARLLLLTSRAMLDLERLDEARTALDTALSLAEDLGENTLLGSAWEFRGRYLEHLDRAEAGAAYQRSIDYNNAAGELRGAALARFFLGRCLDADGRPAQAIGHLLRAHEALMGLDGGPDERMAARVQAALGLAHAHLGQDQQASDLLGEAVTALAGAGLLHYEAEALESWADVRERLSDPPGARALLERALRIHQLFGSAHASGLQSRIDAAAGEAGGGQPPPT